MSVEFGPARRQLFLVENRRSQQSVVALHRSQTHLHEGSNECAEDCTQNRANHANKGSGADFVPKMTKVTVINVDTAGKEAPLSSQEGI